MSAVGRFHAMPATRALLALYADPSSALSISPAQWSAILGSARRSRSIGHLALRLAQAGVLHDVPQRVLEHFESAAFVVRRQRQRLRWELFELADALRAYGGPVILLKGAAYEVQSLPLARARLAGDVDLLVPRVDIEEVERRLSSRGWRSAELGDYDERYYREWSHEIPAMMHPDRGLEVDVHHSIGPALPGDSAAVAGLVGASREVSWQVLPGRPIERRFRVLQPIDQLVHLAIHTYGGSDLSLRLREVMDFDLLFRTYCGPVPDGLGEGSVEATGLLDRARELGQARAMWWTLHHARRWLGTPVDSAMLTGSGRPWRAAVAAMDWMSDRSMLPGVRQRRTSAEFAAELALLTRYQWQRLPVRRLVPHVLHKVRRRLLGDEAAAA